MSPAFEKQYADVLQNLEFGIVRVHQSNPDLLDYQVDDALRALIANYKAEVRSQASPAIHLEQKRLQVFDSVKAICEWRLGRPSTLQMEPLDADVVNSADEILGCLQRIHKSVQRWTKRRGRQGYLTFVAQYVK